MSPNSCNILKQFDISPVIIQSQSFLSSVMSKTAPIIDRYLPNLQSLDHKLAYKTCESSNIIQAYPNHEILSYGASF